MKILKKQLFTPGVVIIASIWAGLWFIMAIFFVAGTPGQIEDDQRFVSERLQPRIDYVQNFINQNNRIPSQNEYIDFMLKSEPYKEIDPNSTNVDYWRQHGSPEFITDSKQLSSNSELRDRGITEMPPSGWVIRLWRGEWSEFYTSWDNRYYTNNYTWKWGIQQAIYCLVIGFLPLGAYLVILSIRNKRSGYPISKYD